MTLFKYMFSYVLFGGGLYYYCKMISGYMCKKNKLLVKINNSNAKLPTKGSEFAAGYDLYSCDEGVIKSKMKGKIDIGLSLIIPNNHYGRIAPRSGLTLNYSLDVGAGVIDSDYRGNISVILFNHGDKDFKYNIGDRIAQIIIEKISNCDIVNITEIDETTRGNNGFGSTGISNNNIDIKYNDNSQSCEEETSEDNEDNEDNEEETNEDSEDNEEETNEETSEDSEEEPNEEETKEEKTNEEKTKEEPNEETNENKKDKEDNEKSNEENEEFDEDNEEEINEKNDFVQID